MFQMDGNDCNDIASTAGDGTSTNDNNGIEQDKQTSADNEQMISNL